MFVGELFRKEKFPKPFMKTKYDRDEKAPQRCGVFCEYQSVGGFAIMLDFDMTMYFGNLGEGISQDGLGAYGEANV